MDPIIIAVIGLLIIMLAIRMFFGVAKMLIKFVVIIVIAVIIWRLLFP